MLKLEDNLLNQFICQQIQVLLSNWICKLSLVNNTSNYFLNYLRNIIQSKAGLSCLAPGMEHLMGKGLKMKMVLLKHVLLDHPGIDDMIYITCIVT